VLQLQRGTSPTISYSYHPMKNQLLNTSSGITLQHDENGNVTNSSQRGSLGYDPHTQMMSGMQTPQNGTVDFKYDASNERVMKLWERNAVQEATLYLHGLGSHPLSDKIDNGQQFIERRYVYGATGLVCILESVNGGAWSETYILKDHLGSTRVAVSKDGQNGICYGYDALGNVVGEADFGNASVVSYARYFYTGQEKDAETGLQNYRARFYDSELFRFYQTDPMGQQFSPYAYNGNSPLINVDKTGKFFEPFTWVAIAAAVGAGVGAGYSEATGGKWWQGAIAGAFIGAGVGALGVGMFGTVPTILIKGKSHATAAWGLTTSIIQGANISMLNAGINGTGFNDLWKHGLAGGASSAVAMGGWELFQPKSLGAKLLYQATSTIFSSVANNIAKGEGAFSNILLGVGPLNIRIKDGRPMLNFNDNWGEAILATYGVAAVLNREKNNISKMLDNIVFDPDNLVFNFKGTFNEGKLATSDRGRAVFSVFGKIDDHELQHVWLTRGLRGMDINIPSIGGNMNGTAMLLQTIFNLPAQRNGYFNSYIESLAERYKLNK
jgi:RHS repeat-associated protein